MAHSKQTIKCYVSVRSISISNQPTSWVSLIFEYYTSFSFLLLYLLPTLYGFRIRLLSRMGYMNSSVSVYASTKSLYVNRTCTNSSSNQTSTGYFRNTVLWHPLCLVRACLVSSVASDSAAGCMCQRNNIAPTVQSSPCFLPGPPYSVPFLPTLIFHPQQWRTLTMRTRPTHHLPTENNTQMARLTPQRG